jgi:hypothetical protein
MVHSSAIAVAANSERLTCGGFSLDKTVRLGNFKFITDYFSDLSLFPRRGDAGTAFMGSTHSGTSTQRQAMIGTPPRSSSRCQAGRGASASPLLEGATRGLRLPLSQPRHGWRTPAGKTKDMPSGARAPHHRRSTRMAPPSWMQQPRRPVRSTEPTKPRISELFLSPSRKTLIPCRTEYTSARLDSDGGPDNPPVPVRGRFVRRTPMEIPTC